MLKQNKNKDSKLLHDNKSIKTTLCVVAGGSGGHVTPALCLAKQWQQNNVGGQILLFTSTTDIDSYHQPFIPRYTRRRSVSYAGHSGRTGDGKIQNTLQTNNKKTVWLKILQVPGKKFWRYPLFFLQVAISLFKSMFFLYKYKPEKIVSTGGLIAVPVGLAAKLLRIPIELYELNVIPGKAIKFLSPFAKKIFITFEQSKTFFKQKTIFTQYPLRFSLEDKKIDKKTIIETINNTYQPTLPFNQSRKTLFLLGGSKGSLFLNNLLKKWIKNNNFETSKLQIIHQTGVYDKTDWNYFYAFYRIPAYYFSYHSNIKDFYIAADTVISRSGAGTLFELEFFQKKSIIIPLKNVALGHQVANANEMAKRNPRLFCVLDQEDALLHNSFCRIVYNHLLSNT